MEKLPNRKNIRLKGYDYRSRGVYHVTICTNNKECLFGHIKERQMVPNAFGLAVQNEIEALPGRWPDVDVLSFIVMPNHVHLLLALYDKADAINGVPTGPYSLGQIIGAFKAGVSRRLGRAIWQSRFYEHIIRGEQDYLDTVEYIRNNPIGWDRDDYYLPT